MPTLGNGPPRRASRRVGVPGRNEHVVDSDGAQPVHDLAQVRPVPDQPRGQVRYDPVAGGPQQLGELKGGLEALRRRRRDGHREL
jgi:hypothetical protein